MATTEELQEWRALRGRFLNALWDAEAGGAATVPVSDLLAATGACDLSRDQIAQLVRGLDSDGLIELTSMAGPEDQDIRLTTAGRAEVEQWLADPDRPTENLPVPANQVFHIGIMNVTGTVMQGSTATNVNTNIGITGDVLVKLVAQFRKLLSAVELCRMSVKRWKPTSRWSRRRRRNLNQDRSGYDPHCAASWRY